MKTDSKLNLKLIPEFDGSVSVVSIVKWVDKVKLVYSLCGKNRLSMSYFCTIGGTFVIYQQLSVEERSDWIKNALYTAFTSDSLAAYKKFIIPYLQLDESMSITGRTAEINSET